MICTGDKSVYVLFPPARVSRNDPHPSQQPSRDEQVLHLAAALLQCGDDFARSCLSQTVAARAASLRGHVPQFADPVEKFATPATGFGARLRLY